MNRVWREPKREASFETKIDFAPFIVMSDSTPNRPFRPHALDPDEPNKRPQMSIDPPQTVALPILYVANSC